MDKVQFVQNIKDCCKAKGVKPTVACRESGAGQSFINNIESRGQVPSVEKVQLLAQYLGVTVSELLGEATAAPPPKKSQGTIPEEILLRSPPLIKLKVSEVEMIEAYRAADQRARDMVDLALQPFMPKNKKARGGAG